MFQLKSTNQVIPQALKETTQIMQQIVILPVSNCSSLSVIEISITILVCFIQFSEICNRFEEMTKTMDSYDSSDACDYFDDNMENNMPDHIKALNIDYSKILEIITPILKKNEEVDESCVPEVVEAVKKYLLAHFNIQ